MIEDWIHKEKDKRYRKRGTRDRGRFAGNGGQGERKGCRKRGQGIKEKIQKDMASDRGRDTESGG